MQIVSQRLEDILGDIHTIIAAKRADTALLFFTDGLTRQSAGGERPGY